MSLDSILLYSATVFIASILPGPSMLLALTHGMQHGVRRTLASALGNLSVTLIQAGVSIAGLGTILSASLTAFLIIKWGGAAFLVYLGASLLLASRESSPSEEAPRASGREASLRGMYLQAALVTAGNPKAIVFFTAVFPQFLNPEKAFLPQFAIIMGLGSVIAFSCFMIYAMGGQKIMALFSSASAGKWIKRIIGGTFIGAGIGLAVSNK